MRRESRDKRERNTRKRSRDKERRGDGEKSKEDGRVRECQARFIPG